MDTAVVLVAGLLLALVAFRRSRGVLTPDARRVVARPGRGARTRRVVATFLAVARAGVGVAALAGIVWLARELFT